MNNVRTVSDTKRTFYNLHTRPINTIYRRVVEELMVEMHLLSVNIDFSYNSIYALGVVTTFDRFMQGYEPERDQESIFNALCRGMEQDPQHYRQDAERLQTVAKGLPAKDLIGWLGQTTFLDRDSDLQAQLQAIANNPNFKYNRLFAIGVFSLLEQSDPELVKDEKQLTEALKAIAAGLHLSDDKLNKDLELYRSNLEKMAQALIVMADMLSADRKKREQRKQQSTTPVAPPSSNE
ncbi:photosystem II biogenesis protein Psp29 [Nostoc sp. XA010]|uniref:photosystem II biogenesis protein Psp29 n=1 Tax=Nostoc sp. XA010 TaxID=2780407 RepID=UPI001E6066D6|nr:photosystem II biogenesis protein Psp29 [Nostoc sp. XA010]MCC5656723.1 photosystem II biogenesis protein Psp29 [Nostoc sp. XA010]